MQLLKILYGVTEAERQWATVIEDWLINYMECEQVKGVSQLFIKRDGNGGMEMILAKATDDTLFSSDISTMKDFSNKLSNSSKVSKTLIEEPIYFNGCHIEQDEKENVTMCMNEYMKMIQPIDIGTHRRMESAEKAIEA